jgi:hypothetical protein
MGGWRKSTHSDGNGGQCVEVRDDARQVLVRDTANRAGSTLAVPAAAWEKFTTALKHRVCRDKYGVDGLRPLGGSGVAALS